jgi:hypothetical protein
MHFKTRQWCAGISLRREDGLQPAMPLFFWWGRDKTCSVPVPMMIPSSLLPLELRALLFLLHSGPESPAEQGFIQAAWW